MQTAKVGMQGRPPKVLIQPAKKDPKGLTPEQKAKLRAEKRKAVSK